MAICEFCHETFKPVGGLTTCGDCFLKGRVHEPLYAVLLRDLRAVVAPMGGTARFTYVGEGDFALEVCGLGTYPIIVATIAEQAENGRWGTRPAVPDPGQPWAIALFRNITQWPQHPEVTALPASDAELVAFVAAHLDDLDAFSANNPNCRICGLPRPCGCREKQEA